MAKRRKKIVRPAFKIPGEDEMRQFIYMVQQTYTIEFDCITFPVGSSESLTLMYIGAQVAVQLPKAIQDKIFKICMQPDMVVHTDSSLLEIGEYYITLVYKRMVTKIAASAGCADHLVIDPVFIRVDEDEDTPKDTLI
jgi:hypothetical protein